MSYMIKNHYSHEIKDQDAERVRAGAEITDPLEATAANLEEGKRLFNINCSPCHGEKGEGNRELGAPALKDAVWLYASDRGAIAAQVTKPRNGIMPAWSGRLDAVTIKQLALYVHSLGGGEGD